jgi:Zn-dependent protease
VRIVVAPSWVLSVAVIAALGVPVISQVIPGTGTGLAATVSIVLGVALGASVLAHELGHCLAARMLGMPVLGVRLYLLGGVSELARAPRSPREEAIIASAGPAVSAVVAGGCGVLLAATTSGTVAWLLVLLLALSNLLIAVFNLLPALPLDGGRVLRAGVWRVSGNRRAGTTAAVIGGYAIAVLLAGWAVLLVADSGSAGLLPAGIAVAMALFVGVGAAAERPGRRTPEWPSDVSLASLARPATMLPTETPVGSALQAAAGRDVLIVEDDGAVRGMLDVPAAHALASRDPQAPASLVAGRFAPDAIVFPGDDPAQVTKRTAGFATMLLIDDDGRPAGVLRREDMLAVLDRRYRKGPA